MGNFIINPFISFGGASFPAAVTGENLDAELGNTTGWTSSVGSLTASTAQAHSGTYSFYNASAFTFYNDIQIDSSLLGDIAAGTVQITTDYWIRARVGTHYGNCYVDFYNGNPGSGGSLISNNKLTGDVSTIINGLWSHRGQGFTTVPTTATWLRLWISSDGECYFDDIDVRFWKNQSLTAILTDADFESGGTTNWTSLASVDDGTVYTTLTGKGGTYFGCENWGSASTLTAYQDVALDSGWHTDIDNGDVKAVVSWRGAQIGGIGTADQRIEVAFYTGTPTTGLISTLPSTSSSYDIQNGNSTQSAFTRHAYGLIDVPATARHVRFNLKSSSGGGTSASAHWDDIKFELWRPA